MAAIQQFSALSSISAGIVKSPTGGSCNNKERIAPGSQ